MEKKIEDYLHLYLGQKCITKIRSSECECQNTITLSILNDYFDDQKTAQKNTLQFTLIKPILRPLSDMNEEEIKVVILSLMNRQVIDDPDVLITSEEVNGCIESVEPDDNAIVVYFSLRCFMGKLYISSHSGLIRLFNEDEEEEPQEFNPELTRYLLSKGFDLFGLIDSGLAIDKIQLK